MAGEGRRRVLVVVFVVIIAIGSVTARCMRFVFEALLHDGSL